MSTQTPSQSRIIRSNQYLSESLGFITKEKEVVKNGCTIKMAIVDLTPYLHEEMGFIDPDFPHVASSVSEITEHKVVWRAAEELVSGANYS